MVSQHRKQGECKDGQIQQQTVIVDVVDVRGHLLLAADDIAAGNLRQAADLQTHFMAARLLGFAAIEVLYQRWSWTNEVHAPTQHIT